MNLTTRLAALERLRRPVAITPAQLRDPCGVDVFAAFHRGPSEAAAWAYLDDVAAGVRAICTPHPIDVVWLGPENPPTRHCEACGGGSVLIVGAWWVGDADAEA